MNMRTFIFSVVLTCLTPSMSWAVLPDEMLKDAHLEQRARELSSELRCMVCQNQSIDDSMAPLARDLRLLVRERLLAGDSDDQIRLFLVARYGDFILLNPPLKFSTLLLWFGPFSVLLLGFLVIWLRSRKYIQIMRPDELSELEQAKMSELLSEGQ